MEDQRTALQSALAREAAKYQENPTPKGKATVEALARAIGRQDPPPSRGQAALRGATQGASLYFGDELMGAGQAAFGIGEGETFNERRQYNTAQERAANAAAETEHPGTYLMGELGGGMLLPGGAAVQGAKAAQRAGASMRPLGRAMTAGGLAGGVASAGLQEGEGDLVDQLYDGLYGTATGAVGGPAIGAAAQKALEVGGNLVGGVARNISASPQKMAQIRVGQRMADDGMDNLESIRARLDELGPEGRLADVGANLQQEAVRIAKTPGPGRRLATDFVEARQRGQESRLEKMTRETVDPKWTDYRGFLHDMTDERKAQAAEAYAVAYLQPITPSDTLVRLSQNNDYFKDALTRAVKNVKNKVDVEGDVGAPSADGAVSTRLMDQVMRELQDMSSSAARRGEMELARDIGNVRSLVRDEVFEANPYLKHAMSIHRGGKELQEAAEYGRNLISGGRKIRMDELDEVAGEWSQSEWDAMQVGLMQGIFDKLEDVATTGDSARKLVSSSRMERILARAFKDDEAYERFMRGVDAESTMQGTRNKVMGGSPTYELQASDPNIPTGQETPMRTFTFWLQNALRKIAADDPAFGELEPRDYEEIAKLLFGEVDDQVLRGVISPTLKVRLRDGPSMGNIGIGTGSVPAMEAGRQKMFETTETE